MTVDDIARTLHELDVIYKNAEGNYCIRFQESVYQNEIERIKNKGHVVLKPECLKWTPFLFKRLSIQGKSE